MAATATKRPLPTKIATMKDRKRRKLDNNAGSTKASSKSKKSQTAADDLAWKSVAMPDHMDDWEGLLGFEEVDDVDVIRDGDTGKATFSAKATPRTGPTDSKALEGEAVVKGQEMGGYGEDDDQEWSGFEDDPVSAKTIDDVTHAAVEKSHPKQQQSKPEPTQKQSKLEPKPKQKTKTPRAVNGKATNGNFGGLGDEDQAAGEVDISAWRLLSLNPDTLSALSKLKFAKPTPIQKAAIPAILGGNDVIGKASTGSGKTLAFGIPILETFLEQRTTTRTAGIKSPLALILSPTRELAHQLDKHLTALCSNGLFDGPSIATLTGGLSVQKQQRLLKHADIVIGTPGRLWEVISEGQGIISSLQSIQFLVVDEADRLLSEGHFKEVEEILNALDRTTTDEDAAATITTADPQQPAASKPERQTLVFSATFDRNLQRKLSNKSHPSSLPNNTDSMEYLLRKLNFRQDAKPTFIDVNPLSQLANNLKEGLIECSGLEKDLYLYTLLLLHPGLRTLVFCNSISAVRRLAPLLQNLNLPVLPLHSGMVQKARLRSIERFTSTTGSQKAAGVLVATDVAARGLDIPNVQLVIHYHLPRAADTYVHRSGRTARAGEKGSSILICSPEEVAGVRRLVAKVHAGAGGSDEGKRQGFFIRTLDLDRRLVSRLKPRLTLAKRIADAGMAKEKGHKEDSFLKAAAEELGVEYDSSADEGKGKRGRGAGRKKKEKESRALSKSEVQGLKAELKALLSKRVNVGVSERYLTSGGVDVDELLARQQGDAAGGTEFLGRVGGLGM